MNLWTSEDIFKILIKLDEMKLPFSTYALCRENDKLNLLGRGGSADVFEAQTRFLEKKKFAMKVIGFRSRDIEYNVFNESVQVQNDINDEHEFFVNIYDHTELWVTLDDEYNVVSAVSEKPEKISRTTIKLQFIIMEKMSSVIKRTKYGNIKMNPEKLAIGDEQEIIRLAYDIGHALNIAHKQNVLHRDVKLENVFYSEKTKRYKLGDFGIAKKTEDGFTGTIAFTKGYAAPEVRSKDDRYDCTADIYSFGMMLYVLSNGLKFPDSNTYNVNFSAQYEQGYIVPKPKLPISTDLYNIIVKACMYNPDERYQSMEEMLLEIEKLLYDVRFAYRKEHKKLYLLLGTMMLILTVGAWKLTMAFDMVIEFSFWEYVFLVGCFGKGIKKAFNKKVTLLSWGVFGIGVYLMLSTGFSWIKLIFILCMTFSSGTIAGYVSAVMIVANFISLIQQTGKVELYFYDEYSWITVTLISIAYILFLQYIIINTIDRISVKKFYSEWLFWGIIVKSYAELFILGCILNSTKLEKYQKMTDETIVKIILKLDYKMIGICVLGFSLFWLIRDKILIYCQKKKMQKKMNGFIKM